MKTAICGQLESVLKKWFQKMGVSSDICVCKRTLKLMDLPKFLNKVLLKVKLFLSTQGKLIGEVEV
jgi:hypothetical protein